MPKLTYATCRDCGRHSSVAGLLSHTRLCLECSVRREEENNWGISTKSGPAFARWRRQMAACVGAVLTESLDTPAPSSHSPR